MNIAVFGLGYVGIVNIACLSKLGHTMWGCDIKTHKVDLVSNGKSPIYEPEVDQLLNSALEKGLVRASADAAEIVANTDMALICVGTPSLQDGTVNLDFTLNTTEEIAACLKRNKKKYTIVYRSTIPPGTVEGHFLPVLQKELGENMQEVSVAFIPEFLREGSAVKDFFHCSRIVIGTDGSENKTLKQVFGYSADIPLVFTSYSTAEYVKYVDNAFHALKIAFANEAYRIGSSYGVDINKANEIFLMDKHLNISPVYLRPGLPFGGSCLPKDLRAINHLAAKKQIRVPLLENVMPSNQQLLNELFELLIKTGKKKITLFGLTFKSGTDDVRESPMLYLSRKLSESGIELTVFDPDINISHLRVEQPWIVRFIETDKSIAFKNAEVIAVCKKGFGNYLTEIPGFSQIINFFNREKFAVSNKQQTFY